MKSILVDTIPANARNQGSVNLGCEIVAMKMGAEVVHWRDTLTFKPDLVAFNVFYPTHLLNICPFLTRNGISPYKGQRDVRVIAGGQGIGQNGILDGICDEVFLGEFEGDETDSKGFRRKSVIDSGVTVKGNKAVIELTRGCKYRCAFCEYGWVHGGKYREKDIELVSSQMDECLRSGIRNVNFLSANFGGYSKIADLIKLCSAKGIRILNSDSCLKDVGNISPILSGAYIKLGVESFDEKTRISVGKRITDQELEGMVDMLLEKCSGIHFYLIYGFPDDNYDHWFTWLEKLAAKRKAKTDRSIRFEFSITNIEPCCGTPLEKIPQVDFDKKHEFLHKWGEALIRFGYHQGTSVWYGNCGGRFGRKPASYRLLMALKKGGPELTEKLIKVYPKGVGRTIKDEVAGRFFKD